MTLSRLRARCFGARSSRRPATAPAAAQAPAAIQADRPSNVVLIITDDVGYGDIGSYGAPDIKTPNIDSLAKNGTRLTDFYAAPNCSPTRAALISGRYQQRVAHRESAWRPPRPRRSRGCAPTGRIAAAAAQEQRLPHRADRQVALGYKPEFSPNAHGFDYFFGFKSGLIDYYQHTDSDGAARPLRERRTDARHRLLDGSLHRPVGEVHRGERRAAVLPRGRLQRRPLAVPGARSSVGGGRTTRDSSSRRKTRPTRGVTTSAIVERADQGVGKILATLERRGLTRNTLVIFTQRQRRRVAVAECTAVPP